jgi:hypothetical protein
MAYSRGSDGERSDMDRIGLDDAYAERLAACRRL